MTLCVYCGKYAAIANVAASLTEFRGICHPCSYKRLPCLCQGTLKTTDAKHSPDGCSGIAFGTFERPNPIYYP